MRGACSCCVRLPSPCADEAGHPHAAGLLLPGPTLPGPTPPGYGNEAGAVGMSLESIATQASRPPALPFLLMFFLSSLCFVSSTLVESGVAYTLQLQLT